MHCFNSVIWSLWMHIPLMLQLQAWNCTKIQNITSFSCCSDMEWIVLAVALLSLFKKWEFLVYSCISGNFTTRARAAGDWGASLQQIHCPPIQRQYGSVPREKGTNRRESRCPHFLRVYPKSRTGALYNSSFFARIPGHGGSGCSPCITGQAEAELETHTALLPLKEAQQPQQTVPLLPCRLFKEVQFHLFTITKNCALHCHCSS